MQKADPNNAFGKKTYKVMKKEWETWSALKQKKGVRPYTTHKQGGEEEKEIRYHAWRDMAQIQRQAGGSFKE